MSDQVRPVEMMFGHPATLADVEAFCRRVRQQGGSDDDMILTDWPFRLRPRGLRALVRLDLNREAAHRRDVTRDLFGPLNQQRGRSDGGGQ